MTATPRLIRCVPPLLLVFVLALAPATAVAQAATGTIQGRVLNPRTGEYLEGARLTGARLPETRQRGGDSER